MTGANSHALRRNLLRMLDAYAIDQARIQRKRNPKRRYVPTGFHDHAVRALGWGDDNAVAVVIHSDELAPYLGTTRP